MAVALDSYREYRPAVAYLRRSTDRQEQSIGDQRKAIERYAEERGFELLEFYTDDAISGTTADQRPAFLQLIEDAKRAACPFRYLLVYDIKRFGRLDNDEASYYRFLLRQAGIEIVYVTENFNGDDGDDLVREVKQWQARQECKDLSKVTIRGLLSRCQGGWWNGGVPPFGYDLAYFSGDGQFLTTIRYQQDCSKLVLDEDGQVVRHLPRGESLAFSKSDRCRLAPSGPERAEAIRNIFDWYVHDGLGFKGIADRLNQMGIPSPRGGNWSAKHKAQWAMTSIRDILLNPAYCGDFTWNRLTSAKFFKVAGGHAVPRKALPGNGFEQNRQEDWITVRDSHPALIARSLFEAAQRKRGERRTAAGRQDYRRGRGATSEYLLSGLIECRRCGHRWVGYTTRKGRRRNDGTQVKTFYYTCGGYLAKGNSCCQRAVIPKDLIEGWVLEQIGRMVESYLEDGGEEKLRRVIEQELMGEGRGDGSDLAILRQRRADIERIVDNLLDNITAANRDYADRRIEKLRAETIELERRQAELLEQQDQKQEARTIAQRALALAQSFDRLVEVGTVDEKRTLIRAFLQRIDFDPETRTGKAYFWAVPSMGRDDPEARPGGRGRRSDLAARTARSTTESPRSTVERAFPSAS